VDLRTIQMQTFVWIKSAEEIIAKAVQM